MIMALKDYQIETEITIFLGSNQKKYVLFYWQSYCRQWKDVSEIPIVSFFNIKKIKAFNF